MDYTAHISESFRSRALMSDKISSISDACIFLRYRRFHVENSNSALVVFLTVTVIKHGCEYDFGAFQII